MFKNFTEIGVIPTVCVWEEEEEGEVKDVMTLRPAGTTFWLPLARFQFLVRTHINGLMVIKCLKL